jgi:hypothetical protein
MGRPADDPRERPESPDGNPPPGLPGEDAVGRLRQRLCDRLVRVAAQAGHDFPSDRDCIRWVILCTRPFDRDWLDRFLAAPPPVPAAPVAAPANPTRRYGRLTLQEWWVLLTPQVLVWGQQQPWNQQGDGVRGLLGEAYMRAAELWDEAVPTFPPATGGGLPARDAVFGWLKEIVRALAARYPARPWTSLAFDPAAAPITPETSATATRLPDRVLIAARVRELSARLPVGVPDLEPRLGGRGTLQLLIAADQLEVALGMSERARRQWCLQTLARRTPPEIAVELETTANYIQRRFGDIRQAAQDRLIEMWCAPAVTETVEGHRRESHD